MKNNLIKLVSILLISLFYFNFTFGQDHTVSGTITDSESGETFCN